MTVPVSAIVVDGKEADLSVVNDVVQEIGSGVKRGRVLMMNILMKAASAIVKFVEPPPSLKRKGHENVDYKIDPEKSPVNSPGFGSP